MQVVGIHLAPGRRLPIRSVDSVLAEGGRGLIGDRYHGARHRHLTLQAATDLAEAADILGRPIPPEATRRNLTVDTGPITSTPGERLQIGTVLLEVVRIAAPCRLLDDNLGPGAATALRRRAGTVFRILTSGTIAVGDQVQELPPEPALFADPSGPRHAH